MAKMRVGIGPNFFKKSFNDYRDWKWALVREAMQNSMDAPHSKNIELSIEPQANGNTLFAWRNDGDPMTEEILSGKLLTLGESGKDFQDTVGGFGKAKEVLMMAHLGYEIDTGYYRVVGRGGEYEIEKSDKYFPGTATRVMVEGDYSNELRMNFDLFMQMAQWNGTVRINNEVCDCRLHKGFKRREFDWCTVYTNKSITNRMVVRIKGIPMFHRHLECNGRCVVVELKNGNSSVLQSNRDALKWQHQAQLEAFADEITVNKVSALREVKPSYFHYSGTKLRSAKASAIMAQIVSEAYATIPVGSDEDKTVDNAIVDKKVDLIQNNEIVHMAGRRSRLNHEFVIKNTTGMVIPLHYRPEEFSEYSEKLTKIWSRVMLALHDLFGKEATFSVGFIFDESREAEYECTHEYSKVYYINPISIVKQDNSNSRSMSKRWKFNAAGRWAIVADALHEFVHGTMGLSAHDECYSSTLTQMTGVILRERQKFNRCFV